MSSLVLSKPTSYAYLFKPSSMGGSRESGTLGFPQVEGLPESPKILSSEDDESTSGEEDENKAATWRQGRGSVGPAEQRHRMLVGSDRDRGSEAMDYGAPLMPLYPAFASSVKAGGAVPEVAVTHYGAVPLRRDGEEDEVVARVRLGSSGCGEVKDGDGAEAGGGSVRNGPRACEIELRMPVVDVATGGTVFCEEEESEDEQGGQGEVPAAAEPAAAEPSTGPPLIMPVPLTEAPQPSSGSVGAARGAGGTGRGFRFAAPASQHSSYAGPQAHPFHRAPVLRVASPAGTAGTLSSRRFWTRTPAGTASSGRGGRSSRDSSSPIPAPDYMRGDESGRPVQGPALGQQNEEPVAWWVRVGDWFKSAAMCAW